MSWPNRFSYHFYPVGQGLFSSGALCRYSRPRGPRERIHFVWVYDCGTRYSQNLIEKALDELSDWVDSPRIDLLFLSHFDQDHISGICRLLKIFSIGTLALPYMPLDQRLLAAFEQGVLPEDDLTTFMINPAAFLAAQAENGIERILFIPASGEVGPPLPEGNTRPQEDYRSDDYNRWEIDFEREDERNFPLEETAEQRTSNGSFVRIDFLAAGADIAVRGVWEFVPYNCDLKIDVDPLFRSQVEARREKLLKEADDNLRREALQELVAVYDRKFGAGGKKRNIISLFVYAGPIYSSWTNVAFPWIWYLNHWTRGFSVADSPIHREERCSILYTGDGYLNDAASLDRLIRFWTLNRVDRCGVFQVMHHGAKVNWHDSVAIAFKPTFSIFSSNPAQGDKHPHAEVLREFWPYGPVQVDEISDFTAFGFLE